MLEHHWWFCHLQVSEACSTVHVLANTDPSLIRWSIHTRQSANHRARTIPESTYLSVFINTLTPRSHSRLKSLKHVCWLRQTRKPKHVLESRASGIWWHWKNNSLLIYATRVSIRTNSQWSCFSLPFFARNAHASKEKGHASKEKGHASKENGLYNEEDGDRCSFKTPGCHIIFFSSSFLLMMTDLKHEAPKVVDTSICEMELTESSSLTYFEEKKNSRHSTVCMHLYNGPK